MGVLLPLPSSVLPPGLSDELLVLHCIEEKEALWPSITLGISVKELSRVRLTLKYRKVLPLDFFSLINILKLLLPL